MYTNTEFSNFYSLVLFYLGEDIFKVLISARMMSSSEKGKIPILPTLPARYHRTGRIRRYVFANCSTYLLHNCWIQSSMSERLMGHNLDISF